MSVFLPLAKFLSEAVSQRQSYNISSAVRFLLSDKTCFIIIENVLSHMYAFPHTECIFSAKSFSLGNLSLLQKLSTVSKIVMIVHFY